MEREIYSSLQIPRQDNLCVCGSAIGGAAYCAKAVLRGHIMFRASLTWPTLAYLLYNIIYVLGVAKQCHKLRQTLPGK